MSSDPIKAMAERQSEASKLADRLDVSDMQRFPALSRADEVLIVHALRRLASQREDVIDREAIARIIDPKNWAIHDSEIASIKRLKILHPGQARVRDSAALYVRDSLTKADAIRKLKYSEIKGRRPS